MTKLLEWLSGAGVFLAMWAASIATVVEYPFSGNRDVLIVFAPLLVAVFFGVYAASVVLYRTFNFDTCREAAEELQKEIAEARTDLKSRGFRFDN